MNIIEKYEALVEAVEWEKVLPVIKEIVDRNPDIETSWFNYGVCLDALEKHGEAADAFIKAHELNVTDYGIHYRIFRSLYLANDLDQLLGFCEYLCETFDEARETLFESEEYRELMKHQPFTELKERYD